MTRTRRIILRVSGALVGIFFAISILCLDGVDYRPYLHESYYAETMARLQLAAATNSVTCGELAAGFGRALLTPKINAPRDDPLKGEFRSLPLAGYGNRHGKFARGVHDDLYVLSLIHI